MLFILITFSLLLPMLFSRITGRGYAIALTFVVALHHIISLINDKFGISLLSLDARKFYNNAIFMLINKSYADWYGKSVKFITGGIKFKHSDMALHTLNSHILSVLPTPLATQTVSIIVYTVFCVGLKEIIKYVHADRYSKSILFIFSLVPTTLIYTSGTMRESYQLLVYVVFCISLIQILRRKIDFSFITCFYICLLVSSTYLGSMLHIGMKLSMLFCLALVCCWYMLNVIENMWLRLLAIVCSAVVFVMLFEQSILECLYRLAHHQNHLVRIKTSTAYHIDKPMFPFINVPYSRSLIHMQQPYYVFKLYLNYLLYPFPWNISNVNDLYAGVIAFFRFIIILCAVASYKPKYIFLYSYVLSVTFIYAVGTSNYGTSIRHNILTDWCLLVLGYPQLCKYCRMVYDRLLKLWLPTFLVKV